MMNFDELIKQEGITVEKLRDEHIFMQGERDRSLYFVKAGLLKAYYISESGKEFVKSFISPTEVIASLTSARTESGCTFNLICMEPTTLLKIDFDKVYELSRHSLEVSNSLNELLLNFSMKKERREFEFLCLSAEERYQLLKERSPELLTRVTQNDIARYLGVTPVALSRIKNRISQ